MKKLSPFLTLLLLLTAVFSLATLEQPRTFNWSRQGADNLLKIMLGDGRRLFADQYFRKADVYFHSGYYPSIFDQGQAPKDTRHMTHQEDPHAGDDDDHEKEMQFLGKPRDIFEQFGRHFRVTEHTHLSGGNEREILPWLRISAELDPQRIDTYTVASYWLRVRLGKVDEAEQFLREGLRANPDSYEILFELGQLYNENRNDPIHARNLWELALQRWISQESKKKEQNLVELEKIAVNLARVEEQQGNFAKAIGYLKLAKKATPHPDALDAQIQSLEKKLSGAPAGSTNSPPTAR
jgi:tetratricopeptide (TPR) repeat protein